MKSCHFSLKLFPVLGVDKGTVASTRHPEWARKDPYSPQRVLLTSGSSKIYVQYRRARERCSQEMFKQLQEIRLNEDLL
jgi:hypothetical protein